MSAPDTLRVLLGEIRREMDVLERIEAFLTTYIETRIRSADRDTEQALTLCQGLTNYYTCVETTFLRVARAFENRIEEERWHQSLLDRMATEVPGIRPRVVSESTRQHLQELLKFRHFVRYYFQLDFDWDKLDFLAGKFLMVREAARQELNEFCRYVEEMIRGSERKSAGNRGTE